MSEIYTANVIDTSVSSDINLVSDELKSMIITAVQPNTFLYRTADTNYKDEQLKDATWSSIGLSLPISFTGDVVKRVFTNLKNARAYHRKPYEAARNACSGAARDEVPEPTWIFWQSLNFLEGNIQRRASTKRQGNMEAAVKPNNGPSPPKMAMYKQQYAQQMSYRQEQLQQQNTQSSSTSSSSNFTQISVTTVSPVKLGAKIITLDDLNQGLQNAHYVVQPCQSEADDANSSMLEIVHMIEEQSCSNNSIVQASEKESLNMKDKTTGDCAKQTASSVWKTNLPGSNKQPTAAAVTLQQIPALSPGGRSSTVFRRNSVSFDTPSTRSPSPAISSTKAISTPSTQPRTKRKSSGMFDDDMGHVADAVIGVAQEVSRAVALNNEKIPGTDATVCSTGRWVSDQLKSVDQRERQRIAFLIIDLVMSEIRMQRLFSDDK